MIDFIAYDVGTFGNPYQKQRKRELFLTPQRKINL